MIAARLRASVAACAITVVCALAVALPPTTASADPAYTFAPSGLDGGGVNNVVVYSPFLDGNGRRPLLVGSDVAGVQRSLDDGRNWTPANGGLTDSYVASLLFSDVVPGKVYAATDSALFVSLDFGQHWTPLPAPVDFDGNGAWQIVPGQEHPRSTGQLLAQGHSGGQDYLYAATATQGVKRSSDDGMTWEAVALTGDHLRSIALDPADPDHLFVGDAENGLQETHTARTGFTFARVPGGPAVPEELRFIGGVLYVAGGTAGIFRYDGSWQALNNGLASGPAWEALTGYVDPGTGATVLYAGCAKPVSGANTVKSTDGGATWTSMTSGPGVTVSRLLYGQTREWWAASNSYLSLGSANAVTTDIAVDPDDPSTVVLANRVGTSVGIQGPAGVTWWPAVRGQMTTVDMVVVADPKLPGRVYVGNMDFTFFPSTDNGRTFIPGTRPSGAPTVGDQVALDPDGPVGTPSRVYLAATKRGENTGVGRIYSNPDPVSTPTAWTDESLPVSNDVLALGVGHAASGNRVILASVAGNGLYRKDGAGWAKVSGTAPFSPATYGSFAWLPGTPVVYAIDGRAVWRSDSAGASGTWVKLASAAAGWGNLSNLVLDPLHPGVLYASDRVLGGVVRFAGADTPTPTTTVLLPLASPGPIAVTPGGGLLAQDRDTGRLLLTDPATAVPTSTDVGDAFFAENDRLIRSLSVGPDGWVYTASNRGGVSVAPPLGSGPPDTTPPSPPGGLTSTGQTPDSVSLTWQAATDDTGVTAYRILRGGVWVGTAPATDPLAYSDTGLLPSTTYTYVVQAVDAAGNVSDPSDPLPVTTLAPPPDTTAPTSPTGLTGRVVSATRVALTWQSSTDAVGVVAYRVTRDDGQTISVPTPSWTDTAALTGGHTYAVTALDAAGNESDAALTSVTVPAAAPAGLTGTYFDTATFTSQKLVRVDPTVNFAWGTGSPAKGIGADTFSTRWTGRVIVPSAGTWTFITQSDNGVRLWVDGVLLINNWTAHPLTTNKATVTLGADRAHVIRIDYFEQTGSATMKLLWSGPGTAQQVVPAAQLLSR